MGEISATKMTGRPGHWSEPGEYNILFLGSVLVISSQDSSALGYREVTQEGAMTISPLAAREGTSAPQWPIVKQCCLFSILDGRNSETGRIRFRRVRFQTPNSVSFFGLTEFRGANSVSSFQPIICVQKRTHRVSGRTHRVCRRTQ